MRSIRVNDDQSEIVPYPLRHMPVFAQEERLSYYFGLSMAAHWHDELEFLLIREGTMRYFIEGRIRILRPGDALFVNARRLHSGDSVDGQDCRFDCALFRPELVRPAGAELIERVVSRAQPDAVSLRPTAAWQREIISSLETLFDAMRRLEPGYTLEVMSRVYRCFLLLYRNLDSVPEESRAPLDGKRDILHRMIGFIQEHYAEPVSLLDIAGAADVGKSYCCSLFQSYLHCTPVGFLNAYRLEQSLRLLSETALNNTQIASLCGFSTPSYFSAQFRAKMGISPKEYRKRRRASAPGIHE